MCKIRRTHIVPDAYCECAYLVYRHCQSLHCPVIQHPQVGCSSSTSVQKPIQGP